MANNINIEITEQDKFHGTGKSVTALAKAALESLTNKCNSVTFIHEIPSKHKAAVEATLKREYEIWANTWIAPKLRQIIAKQKR